MDFRTVRNAFNASLFWILFSSSTASDLSFEELFAPKPHYPYFQEHSEKGLANATSAAFSLPSGILFAEMSMLCYVVDVSIVKSRLLSLGFETVAIAENCGSFALMASNETHSMVIFRGTEIGDSADFLTDINFQLKAFDKIGYIHRGFGEALESIETEIDVFLKEHHKSNTKALILCGHSLGGALATLYGLGLPDRRPTIYTYGAPRVGDAKIAKAIDSLSIHRIINNNDIIARLPTGPIYQDSKDKILITSEYSLKKNPSALERLQIDIEGHKYFLKSLFEKQWKHGEFNAIPSDFLVDHSPVSYIEALKIAASK